MLSRRAGATCPSGTFHGKPTTADDRIIRQADSAVASALRTLETGSAGIAALASALQGPLGAAFSEAVELIRQAKGRVIVTGLGKSGHVARKVAATLASTGTPAFFVHAAEASHGDLGMITPDDVIVALSWSGEQPEMKNLVNYSARFAIPMIALTSNAQSSLGAAARIVLELPKAREACPHNLAPTTSTLMQAAIGDALAIALLESRGFTALEFANFHPGGKLGAMLKHTSDLMHTGDELPLKPLGTVMSDALAEMSAKGFGCVAIVGCARGDRGHHHRRRSAPEDAPRFGVGHRRRDHDAQSRRPSRGTRSPAKRWKLLNSSKITTLVVTDAGKPVGIIHLHDLLRAGVASCRASPQSSFREASRPDVISSLPILQGFQVPFARYDTVR